MKIAMSTLAWAPAHDAVAATVLRAAGAEAIEIAPTKYWSDLAAVSPSQIAQVRRQWEACGLPVVAVQSLLFGREDLTLFGPAPVRSELLRYLTAVCDLAAGLGARTLVFGSPRNRRQAGVENASEIAREFFAALGDIAASRGVIIGLEPNAPQYGCDWMTTAAEGLAFVQEVDSPGLRLHLDTACMALSGDDPAMAIEQAGAHLTHFHISEPDLGQVGREPLASHGAAADALRRIDYTGYCSVEMRPLADHDLEASLKLAARFAVEHYGGTDRP